MSELSAMDLLLSAGLLAPLGAAALIGVPASLGEALPERVVSRVSLAALTLSTLTWIAEGAAAVARGGGRHLVLAPWLTSGDYKVELSLHLDAPGLVFAGLSALVCLAGARFSVHYMHRERGFSRFFGLLDLFAFGMTLLGVAGNAALSFVGWELGGLCSALLIAFHAERPSAGLGGVRAVLTNRVGDVGFAIGLAGLYLAFGSVDWAVMEAGASRLSPGAATALALCFLLPGVVKAGLAPFTPWVGAAVEGPTPSSALFYGAIMVHAGLFLAMRAGPLLAVAPAAAAVAVLLGLVTAVVATLIAKAATDVKGSLVHAGAAQLGVGFVLVGLGLTPLALWHLVGHALVRGLQMFTAPAALAQLLDRPVTAVSPMLAQRPGLYAWALRRFDMEALHSWLVIQPTLRVAELAARFDARGVDAASGLPVNPELSVEERPRHPHRARGLVGRATVLGAGAAHAFERSLMDKGVSEGLPRLSQTLGARLRHVEAVLASPWAALALVLLGLAVLPALGGL